MSNHYSNLAVIDDDDLFRRSASILLSKILKKQVFSFESAEAAWDHLGQAEGPDIILSDINMPGMDGLELLELVKQRYPEKVVILMSGYPENRQLALSLGANAYIDKPFSIKEISELISFFEKEHSPERESLSA